MYKVLIVEDDPMVAAINKQYVMQNSDFTVIDVCNDGMAAYRYLKSVPVDLVILDVYMPRMNGLQLLHKLREDKLSVMVIMVTAANNLGAIEEALSLGVVDYLVKPFSDYRFQQALETFKNRRYVLEGNSSFNQNAIDAVLNGAGIESVGDYPKGIQPQTIHKIVEYMKNRPELQFTSEEISDEIGLSRVTVRRYMTYLCDQKIIVSRMNYETGGRPCMLYRWNKQ
ncbi:MAG: response regulator [Lachnospiraceae bacterium]|nr:response regulator [Lachnospiraceae bacterium]